MNTWVWLVLAALAVAVLGFVVLVVLPKRRSDRLRTGFGPEYDRTVDATGDKRQAEAELTQRANRRSSYEIRPLQPEAREAYKREWERTQAHFVDEPVDAVARADQEIMRVMRERGYPVEDFDQRAADISVDHPKVVEGYRTAHQVATRAAAGEATTEDLRMAMVHYRALFQDLLVADDEQPQQARDATGVDTTREEHRRSADDSGASRDTVRPDDAAEPTKSRLEEKR